MKELDVESRLDGSMLDPEALRRLREDLAAEIFDELDELLGLNVEVVGDACSKLASLAVFTTLNTLCPEILAPPNEEVLPAYNERLSPSIRRRVVRQLGTILSARLPRWPDRQIISSLALEMVRVALSEIAPSVLAQPLEHAQAIARALCRITVRLSSLYPRQGAFDEHAFRRLLTNQQTPFDEYTCMELAGWVLFESMKEIYPVVLAHPAVDQ